MKPYVLLIGYRQALAIALHKMGIHYSVWSEQALKSTPRGVDQVIIDKFPTPTTDKDQVIQSLALSAQPTHVIAGTEASVFPAAVLRRSFGARRSPKTLLTRCTDKAAMKNYLRKFEIPMTRFVQHHAKLKAPDLVEQLGLPLVIKRKRGSGGRNIVIARTLREVSQNMHRSCLYEAFVDAPEGSIESIVDNGKIVFSSMTDYFEKKFSNIVPARFTASEITEIETLNRRVIESLRIKWGLTHLEYYRTATGLLFGEVALRPPGGYIMKLIAEAHGFDPWQSLVEVELGIRPSVLPIAPPRFAGCLIFHPGAGVVSRVSKPTEDEFPSLIQCRLKATVGDIVDPRHGVGEDLGYCIFASEQYSQVVGDIRKLQLAPPVQTD